MFERCRGIQLDAPVSFGLAAVLVLGPVRLVVLVLILIFVLVLILVVVLIVH